MKQQAAKKSLFKVGLTGGIASGKTTVSSLFAELGVPVIDTDVIAREIVAPGQPAIDEIRVRFGDAAIYESGELDRAAMRKLVFRDDAARADLEAILHPRIGDEVRRRSRILDGTYQIIVVPLLVDSPLLQFLDRVVVVDCPEAKQIERLLKRDSGTIEDAKRMIASQPSRQERLKIADDVIQNNSDLLSLHKQVIALHETYQRLAVP